MKKRRTTSGSGSHKRKEELLQVRLSATEKQAFEQAADIAGLSLSTWVRDRLRQSSRRELFEAGRQVPFIQQEAGL